MESFPSTFRSCAFIRDRLSFELAFQRFPPTRKAVLRAPEGLIQGKAIGSPEVSDLSGSPPTWAPLALLVCGRFTTLSFLSLRGSFPVGSAFPSEEGADPSDLFDRRTISHLLESERFADYFFISKLLGHLSKPGLLLFAERSLPPLGR